MYKIPQAVGTLVLCSIMFACGGGSSSSQLAKNGGTPGGGTPQDTFFALNMGPANPWPNTKGISFGIWRSLGAQLRWSDLQPNQPSGGATANPNDPSYDWTSLDRYFALATAHGQKILFTAYYTPTWASQQPSQTCQAGTPGGPSTGGCYPPIDVGSGDLYWKDFLAALYAHATANGWHIATYECWNEPNVSSEYAGALSDLNTLCSDMRSTILAVDSTAKFTTPAPTNVGRGSAAWLGTWINNGYAKSADIIAFHGYVCDDPSTCTASSAELISSVVLGPLQQLVSQTAGTANDVTSMPLWDTEGSDDTAKDIPISDPDLHAAFYARFALLQQSDNIATFAYWGWNFGNGISLLDLNTGQLNAAGLAWQQLYNWTVGAKYGTPGCGPSNGTSVYTCNLTAQGGGAEMIVWDSANVNSCSNDVCGNTTFAIPSGSSFSKCTDLAGNSCTGGISGGAVTVGAKPVLLQ